MKRLLWIAPWILIGSIAQAEDNSQMPTIEVPALAPAVAPDSQAEPVDMSEAVLFERRKGIYVEGRGGVFFTLGGSRGYSNGQPFFGFEVGYDITDRFSLQIAYASGYQSSNPVKDPIACGGGSDCNKYHLDFGLTFFDLSADFDVLAYPRFALEVRLGGGVTLVNPSATPDQGPVDGNIVGGLRFEYYTLLKHFTIGAETDFYYILPTNIPAMAISASILYNF